MNPPHTHISPHSINDAFCELLESGPKPVVAAIRGLALGGGLEVALACAARVATPRAKLGLPELQLGILPGFGGTQRLPRLVGLQTGLKMILTSAPLAAEKAVKAGLIDEIAPPDALLPRAKALALAIARGEAPRLATLTRTDRLEPLGEALQVLDFAAAESARRAPNLTHPLLTIDAIKAGVTGGGRAGLAAEAAACSGVRARPSRPRTARAARTWPTRCCAATARCSCSSTSRASSTSRRSRTSPRSSGKG